MSMLLGKPELIQWAAQTSHVHPCAKYDDLKDGLIFLVLAEKLFPALADPSLSRPQRNGPRNPKLNWEVLLSMLRSAGVPTEVCDKKGIGAGHQKPCYNMLVMFYFLSKLKLSSDFAVDFAHPIDDRLAAFLQSEQSLECLRGVQPGSHSQPTTTGRSVSPAHPATSPSRNNQTPRRGSTRNMASNNVSTAATTPTASQGATHHDPVRSSQGATHPAQALDHHHLTDPKASSVAVVQWDSSEAQQHGEAVIVRLRAEVKSGQRRIKYLNDELTHVKALGQHTMEQQRVLVESEMMRASQQFQSQLSMVKIESTHTVAATAQHFELELEAALQQFEVERVVSSYESKQPAQSEVLHLRESKIALEKKVAAAEARGQALHDEQHILREQLAAQTTVIERMHRTVQAAGSALNDPDNFQLEGISEAAQTLVRSRFRELGQENASLKAHVQRLEEELKGRTESNSAGDQASEGKFELAQCRQRIQELQSVNTFLRKQAQHSSSSSGQQRGGGDRDFMQEVIKDEATGLELAIPSSCVHGLGVDELSAQTMDFVTSLKTNLEPEAFSLLQDHFWRLGAGISVLRHRLEAAGDHLRHMVQRSKEQVKNHTVETRRLHNEVAVLSRERQMDARQVDPSADLSQANLEISLLSDELQQTRREAAATSDRLKGQLSDLLKDSERQHSDLRNGSSRLSRQVTVMLAREQQYKQLTSLLEQRHRQPTDRQIHEAQINSLQNSLDVSIDHQILQDARQGGGGDMDGQITQATATIRHHYTNTVNELENARAENAALRDTLRQLTLQREGLEASAKRSNAELENGKKDNHLLENNLRQAVDEVGVAQSQFEAERDSWRSTKMELENYAQKLGSAVVEGRTNWDSGEGITAPTQRFGGGNEGEHPTQNLGDSSVAPTTSPSATSAARSGSNGGGGGPVSFTSSSYLNPRPTSTPSTPQPQPTTTTTTTTTTSSSSVLSPKELEKRKLAILSKYGVANPHF